MPKFSCSFVEFKALKFADAFDRRLTGLELSAVISVSEPILSIDKFGTVILDSVRYWGCGVNKTILASDLSISAIESDENRKHEKYSRGK